MNIFACKFVYIVRTDQNPFGSCQPFSILYIMMTACAAAFWATVVTWLEIADIATAPARNLLLRMAARSYVFYIG